MPLIVEDGTGVTGSNGYVSEDYLDAYADDREVTLADGDAESAIIRASQALDAIYRWRFNGYRTHGRNQALEWPRTAAYDREGYLIGAVVPIEVQKATCEMAIRELADPGSMIPDLERGGQVQMLRAGSVEIVYGSNALAKTTFQIIDGIMSSLLGTNVSPLAGTALRG